jgi:hypothetical protein
MPKNLLTTILPLQRLEWFWLGNLAPPKKTTTFPSRNSPKRFSLFHVDCSALSSTLGTPRGRPSFPGLDTCLHFHLSCSASATRTCRKFPTTEVLPSNARHLLSTPLLVFAARAEHQQTSKGNWIAGPLVHRGLSPSFHVISTFVPVIRAGAHPAGFWSKSGSGFVSRCIHL